MDRLTPRQSEIVLFCRRYADKHGFAPSLREIAEEFNVNVNAVAGHLAAAAKKGAISRSARTARGLVVHDATDRKANPRGVRRYATAK
jgi:SOS-response transcriptional repressor LexA